MGNLRPLLSVNSVHVISDLVSNLLYDIIEVMKSKILPLRLQTVFCLVQYNVQYKYKKSLGRIFGAATPPGALVRYTVPL
jgi:hypothetical protein